MKNLKPEGRSEYEFEFEGVLKKANFFGADFLPELRRVVESHAPRRTNYFLEWGTGLSTLLLADIVAQRGGHLVTVDTNQHYQAAVMQAIHDRSMVTAIAADLTGPRRSQQDPELNYTTLPLSFDRDFDFILIDGRRRLECAFSALLLTHSDSVIVLHDYRRARYQVVHSFVDTIEAGSHFLVMRPKPELSHALEPSRLETRRLFGNAPQALAQETSPSGDVPEAKKNGKGKVVFGCVAENNLKFFSRTLRLLQSIRWFGGTLADADFIACVVDNVEPSYAEEFERLGARVRVVPRFNPDNPFANKTQFFTLPELADYETAILLDCDTILVADPSPFLLKGTFQAKIADLPTVPTEVLASLCEHFGLADPAPVYQTTFGQVPTIWYCNSGVLVCPVALMTELVSAWREYEMKLTSRPDLLGRHRIHRGQAALALAFITHPIPFQELPVGMNLPLHITHLEPPPELLHADPVILHYHDLVDSAGCLRPSPYPHVQKRIQIFNDRLREHEVSMRGSSLRQLDEKEGIIDARDETIDRLQDELSASREESQQAANLNESLRAQVDESENVIPAPDDAIALVQDELAESEKKNWLLSAELSARTQELAQITNSLGWRLMSRYGQFKYRFLLPVYRALGLPPFSRTWRGDNRAAHLPPHHQAAPTSQPPIVQSGQAAQELSGQTGGPHGQEKERDERKSQASRPSSISDL